MLCMRVQEIRTIMQSSQSQRGFPGGASSEGCWIYGSEQYPQSGWSTRPPSLPAGHSFGVRPLPLCLSRDKMKEPTMNATEPVYMELVDFVAHGSTAEQVANFRPSPEAQKRVAELLERQRELKLTEEETAELDGFVQLEHILGLAKAKAQLILVSRS